MSVEVARVYENEHYTDDDRYADDGEDVMDSRFGEKLKRLPIDQTHREASSRFESSSRVNRVGDSTVEGVSKGVRVKVNKIFDGYGSTKFPRIEECAHFHYDQVNLGEDFSADIVDADLVEEKKSVYAVFSVKVIAGGSSWRVKRSYEDFQGLDRQLHRCVFDRRFTCLPPLKSETDASQRVHGYIEEKRSQLSQYLTQLFSLSCRMISCGPILNWFEIDCKGRQLQPTSKSGINIPAVAAARVIKSYKAQESDEVSLVLNEIVSIIDMPPESETQWWRGKAGFKVGFFPSYCVEVIHTSSSSRRRENAIGSLKSAGSVDRTSKVSSTGVKPVLAKRGKMLSRLRSVLKMRPSKEELQQSGILKSRIFGADLSEHLQDAGLNVPAVVRICTTLLERKGLVEGVYRLPGISSNINRLRQDFDANKIPNVEAPQYLSDIHSIGSLCKMYFRELPNPLLTYQLYSSLEEACQIEGDSKRREAIAQILGRLPPKHFSTMEHLIKHLALMASHSDETKMTSKNLAIVWAPNLMKPRDTGGSVLGLFNIASPSVVVKSLIDHVDWYFGEAGMEVMRKGSVSFAKSQSQRKSQTVDPHRHSISARARPRPDAEWRSKTTDDLATGKQRRKPPLASSYGGKSLRSLFSRKGGKSYDVSKRPVISGPVNFVGAIPAAAVDAKEIRKDGDMKSQTLPPPSSSATGTDSVDLGRVGRRHTRLAAAFSAAFSRGSIVERGFPHEVSLDDTAGMYRTLDGRGSLGSDSESGSSLTSPGITMIDSPETARAESMVELGQLVEERGEDVTSPVMSTDIDSYMAANYRSYETVDKEENGDEDSVEFSEL
ncbi:rho GTPase-activating protein 33-like isoform X2 [Oscarella lobularis]|uniref:rho GTPase-activating protein 33-like isoform X2 n=1 Tax=Oscarella lobularis TaxID=121494 RepID=UPI0033140BB8